MVETVGALIIAGSGLGGATGIAGLGTLAGTTVAGVSIASIVGTAAVLGVSIGLQYAFRPDVPKPEDGSFALEAGDPATDPRLWQQPAWRAITCCSRPADRRRRRRMM
jgi:hypothetical protein